MLQGMIIRGTTPKYEFDLAYSQDEILDIRVVCGQKGKLILTKNMEDCKIVENKLVVSFNQEDTLLFSSKKALDIEIKAKLSDESVVRIGQVLSLRVLDSLDSEIFD